MRAVDTREEDPPASQYNQQKMLEGLQHVTVPCPDLCSSGVNAAKPEPGVVAGNFVSGTGSTLFQKPCPR